MVVDSDQVGSVLLGDGGVVEGIVDGTAPTLGQVYSPYALVVSGLVFLTAVVAGPLIFRRFAPLVTEKL